MSGMVNVLNEAIFRDGLMDSTSQKSESKMQIRAHQYENILLIYISFPGKHLKSKTISIENEPEQQGLPEFCIPHLNITV